MRRMMLLAIGLCALLWTASARPADVPGGIIAMSGVESCALSAGTDGPSDADLKWLSQLHTIGIVTESNWKSAPVHVGLGATRSPRTADISLVASSPDPPAASAPHYLRHTPLLI